MRRDPHMALLLCVLFAVLAGAWTSLAIAQPTPVPETTAPTSEPATTTPEAVTAPETASPETASPETASDVLRTVEQQTAPLQEKAQEIGKQIDADPRAQEASAGILQPIYALAEAFKGTLFYWSAFTLMTIGVVSFALQLVLGKLALLMRLKLNLTEVVSDTVGLAISVVGLVLTTQAAVPNSQFTQSPALVLSGTAVGIVVGFVLYRWGQLMELSAAEEKKEQPKPAAPKK